MKNQDKPKTYTIELTQGEMKAIWLTADQYSPIYDKLRTDKFKSDYKSAMLKLQKSITS